MHSDVHWCGDNFTHRVKKLVGVKEKKKCHYLIWYMATWFSDRLPYSPRGNTILIFLLAKCQHLYLTTIIRCLISPGSSHTYCWSWVAHNRSYGQSKAKHTVLVIYLKQVKHQRKDNIPFNFHSVSSSLLMENNTFHGIIAICDEQSD